MNALLTVAPRRTSRSSGSLRALALAMVAGAGLSLGGCNNAVEGGASGAALGALVGMGLGSLSGDMGKGAAAGALLGGLGGAVLGDQNRRSSGGQGLNY